MKVFLIYLTFIISLSAESKYRSSEKISCIQQSNYRDKTLSEQKKILIENAKHEALEELYGTLIYSATDVVNDKIVHDEIKARAVGAVRVNGNPSFYNGNDFGEICSKVECYITKKDLAKYSSKVIKLKNFCFNDSSVSINNIKQEARYKVYKTMIRRYKASLNLSGREAKKFIHGFEISNDNFDINTESYCFDAKATILPYELEIVNVKSNEKNFSKSKPKNLDSKNFNNWMQSL